MAIEDLLPYLAGNPQFWPIVVDVVSGYVLFSSLYRGSPRWRRFDPFERWILGGLIGLFFGTLIIWPITDAISYMASRTEANSGLASAILFGALSLVILGSRLSPRQDKSMISVSLRVLVLTIVIGCVAVGTCSLIVALQIGNYQTEVTPIIAQYWSGWYAIDLLLFISATCGALFDRTFLKMSVHSQKSADQMRSVFDSRVYSKNLLRSLTALLLILNILVGVIVVIDWHYTPLFAPTVTRGEPRPFPAESCETSDQAHSGWLVLIRNTGESYDLYEASILTLSARLPQIYPLVNSLSIPNPSNASVRFVDYPALSGQDEWRWIWANGSDGVSFTPIQQSGNLAFLQANLTNVHNQTAQFNIFYWQTIRFADRGLRIREEKNVTNLGQGLYLDKYSFIITNQEERCVVIPRMYLLNLNYMGANSTSAVVWINETRGFSQGVDHGTFYPWATVDPGKTANVTVTFLTAVN